MKRTLAVVVCTVILIGVGRQTRAQVRIQPDGKIFRRKAPPRADPANLPVNLVSVSFEFYRVVEDAAAGTTATIEDKKKEPSLVFFTCADLMVGGVRLIADTDGWTWDGKERPPKGGGVEMLGTGNPLTVGVVPDGPGRFFLGAPIKQFAKRVEGLVDFQSLDLRTKHTLVSITAGVKTGNTEQLILKDFTIQWRSIQKRKPGEGANGDPARPVLRTREREFTIAAERDLYYGILFDTEEYGLLIMRFGLDMAHEAARPRSPQW